MSQMSLLRFLFITVTIISSINASSIANLQFARKCFTACSISIGVSLLPIQVVSATDAFAGAMNAMSLQREKTVVERSFDNLPEGAKKRKALALCKDSSALKSAGYNSGSQCSSDVIKGNYDSIMTGASNQGG